MPRHFQDAPPEIREQLLHVRRLFERSARFRGSYLDLVATIDGLLTDIIAFLLTGPHPKRFAMATHLLTDAGAVRLSAKIDLLLPLIRMLDRGEPKPERSRAMTWAPHTSEAEALSELVSDLHKIRKLRNRLAHVSVDTSEQFLSKRHDDRIQLRWFEDGREKTQLIKIGEMKKHISQASDVAMRLISLSGALGFRQIEVRPPLPASTGK